MNNRDDFTMITNTDNYEQLESAKSNNRKKKMFSMLGVLAIILVVLIFVGALKVSIDNKGDDKATDISPTSKEVVSFSFGKVNGNVYENRWADIKCSVNGEWTEATKEQYSTYKDESTTCVFDILSNDKCEIAILLIDLSKHPSFINYSEDMLLSEFSVGVSSKIENANTSKNSYQMLGNQLYLYADVKGKISNREVCVTSYLRKLDDYAIVVNISSNSAEKNHVLSDLIESCI